MQRVIPGLGYLGLLPFLASAYLVFSGGSFADVSGTFLFVSYSAIILSFMAGVLWGRSLPLSDDLLMGSLLIGSNIFAILAWVSLFLGGYNYALALACLMLGYVFVLFLETRYQEKLLEDLSDAYLSMRVSLTAIVLVAHGAVLLRTI